MPRGLNNWTYKDLEKFLRSQKFQYSEKRSSNGSHRYFFKKTSKGEVMVDVNYITGSETYRLRTLETMVRQSCIPKKEWRDWAKK